MAAEALPDPLAPAVADVPCAPLPKGRRGPKHLVLVGMMGTGKSTVGRIVAQRLKRPLIDSDAEIEARHGRTVRQIFADDGEAAFRSLETSVLIEALEAEQPSVIAAAGGVVLSGANREALRVADCRVVWLRAEPKTLVDRVKGGGHRPLLDDDPAAVLQKMFDDRVALYKQVAHCIISVDQRSPIEVAEAVLR